MAGRASVWFIPSGDFNPERPTLADLENAANISNAITWDDPLWEPITLTYHKEDEMSDRAIMEYAEDTTGPEVGLRIERSASGDATALLTVWYRHRGLSEEMTVMVEDAPKVFAPLVQWLREKEAENGRE